MDEVGVLCLCLLNNGVLMGSDVVSPNSFKVKESY